MNKTYNTGTWSPSGFHQRTNTILYDIDEFKKLRNYRSVPEGYESRIEFQEYLDVLEDTYNSPETDEESRSLVKGIIEQFAIELLCCDF